MPHKKPPAPAPPVASTGCSGLMSCLSLNRRSPPPAPPSRGRAEEEDAPLRPDPADGAAAEQYLKRVQFLEEEIRRLGKWLGQEERTNMAATGGGRAGSNAGKVASKDHESAGGTATTTTTRIGHGASGGVQKMAKLDDGSYLHEIARVGRPWERLAVQVSQPIVPENAPSASEVLDRMTRTKAESLAKMMPMKDIAGRPKPGEAVRRTARLSSGGDYLEALLFKAMDKMEGLVLEGLKIQMASPTADSTAAALAADRKKQDAAVSKGWMVHVVLIQVRDPVERYAAIGEPMIGLLEASLQKKDDGKVKLEVNGLHVAGIGYASSNRSDDGRGLMWSASLRDCKASSKGGSGDGCRCSYVRNPNRVFQW